MQELITFRLDCGTYSYCDNFETMNKAGGSFVYFAYGSNLLTERIHYQNPSAKSIGIACLRDYRLDFRLPSKVLKIKHPF